VFTNVSGAFYETLQALTGMEISAVAERPAKLPPDRSPMSADQAAINRANARLSTGPKTEAGKLRSSQNAFQHGLYSTQLIIPGEDPAEFDVLRANLRREYQPLCTTEEILVDELAQQFWRMRRCRELEARIFHPDNLTASFASGLLRLVERALASAERGFHRSLQALLKLQENRTHKEAPTPSVPHHVIDSDADDDTEFGFVPQDSLQTLLDAEEDGDAPIEDLAAGVDFVVSRCQARNLHPH